MSLYEIIKALQEVSGSNAKLAILQQHRGNLLLKAYIEATLSPRVNFFVSKKTMPKAVAQGRTDLFDLEEGVIQEAINFLAKRKYTGQNAKDYIQAILSSLTKEGQALYEWMLLKDFRAKVGHSLVSKVWPELSEWVPKYMRCELPSNVNLQQWPWEEGVLSQVKADGMYVQVGADGILTRNGSVVDVKLLDNGFQEEYTILVEELREFGVALTGELLVHALGKFLPLDRKTSNGMLNSVLAGNPLPEGFYVTCEVWDYIKLAGKFSVPYNARLSFVDELMFPYEHFAAIDTREVFSYQEAIQHFQEVTASGGEGTVVKHPHGLWKNGDSKYQVKIKIEVEIDLFCYNMVEGQGKNGGMLGALRLQSSCGNVVVDCGTGFTDEQRKDLWKNKYDIIGSVVTIKTNDLLTKEGSDILSLFIPVFIEIRKDKKEADDLPRIKQIFDSAKGLK
jgi:DNA ligase-1